MFGNNENDSKNPNWTNKNWLKSRFHFSFAEYMNPRNMGFGVVRVFNDDLVQPSRGKTAAKYFFIDAFLFFITSNVLPTISQGLGSILTVMLRSAHTSSVAILPTKTLWERKKLFTKGLSSLW
jgi:hypothetical protein